MGRTHGKGPGWLWGPPTLLLVLGLLAARASAEEGVTGDPEDGTKTTVIDVTGDRTVIENEDGSKTITSTVTHTNGETGAVRTAVNEVNVQRTESGRDWTRDTAVSGSNGFNLDSTTAGSATRNGDGSGSWNSTTNGTISGPNRNGVDYTTERAGDWQLNGEGGRDFSSTATTTTANGGTSTVNRNLSTYQLSEGVKGFTGESNRTFGNGATVDRTVEGSVTRTETGREWDATVEGTATGPNGQTRSWTTDIDGSVTRNADGSLTYNSDKTVTGEKGGTLSVDKEGTLSKGDDNKWHYEGSKDVSRTPPAPPTGSGSPTAANQTQQNKWAQWKENAGANQTNAADRWAQWREQASENQLNGERWNGFNGAANENAGSALRDRLQSLQTNRTQNWGGAASGADRTRVRDAVGTKRPARTRTRR